MLKYRIEELLREMPYNQAKLAFRWLPSQLGITPKTFREWRQLKAEDSRSIPAEKLFQIATFFAVEPIDLFTEQPEPIIVKSPEYQAGKISKL